MLSLPPVTWGARTCFGVTRPLSCRVDGREVHATIPETGLTHRIKALFENAMRSDNGSQCPLLWRMYLNFLVRKYLVFVFMQNRFFFLSEKVQATSSHCVGKLGGSYLALLPSWLWRALMGPRAEQGLVSEDLGRVALCSFTQAIWWNDREE